MTDNRTNEPTEAQVEAAAKAMWDLRKRASDPEWEGGELDHGIKEIYRQDARAALVAAQGVFKGEDVRALAEAEVRKTPAEGNPISEPGVTKDIAFVRGAVFGAAQGAAPEAESAPTSSYISPSLPGMIRNLWKSDPSENSVRTALKLAGDLIQELIDLRAAPVQPSSTESPVEPFKTWFARWWENEPNAIAGSNAQSAFYAGWDARGLPSSGVDEERAEAVRETARYIDRIAPDGLVPKKMILADMETAADRLGRGYRANGNDREQGR